MQFSGQALSILALIAAGALGGQIIKIVATKGWGYVLRRAHEIKAAELARLQGLANLPAGIVDRVTAIESDLKAIKTKLGL